MPMRFSVTPGIRYPGFHSIHPLHPVIKSCIEILRLKTEWVTLKSALRLFGNCIPVLNLKND